MIPGRLYCFREYRKGDIGNCRRRPPPVCSQEINPTLNAAEWMRILEKLVAAFPPGSRERAEENLVYLEVLTP